MVLCTFRQETLPSALAAARQSGPTAFGFHAGTETVLPLSSALGRLIGAFHPGALSGRAK
jgi:hypothetical protein